MAKKPIPCSRDEINKVTLANCGGEIIAGAHGDKTAVGGRNLGPRVFLPNSPGTTFELVLRTPAAEYVMVEGRTEGDPEKTTCLYAFVRCEKDVDEPLPLGVE